MPRFADLATVTRQDIRHFDTDAKKLVDMFHDAGWRSYMSNNSHAIMQAPDGETTASVSGHNNRAQVRRGREELKRWLRKNRKRSKGAGPRERPRVHEHHHEPEQENRLEPDMTTMPTSFKCLDCPDGGREFKTGQALAMHRQRTHDGLTCPECRDKFWSPIKYNRHREEKHGIVPAKKFMVREVDGVFPCPFPSCPAKFGTRVGLGSHMKVHKDQAPPATNGASHSAPPAVAVRPSSTLPTLRPVAKKAAPEPEPVEAPAVEAAPAAATESADTPNGLDDLLGDQDPAEALTNVLAILAPPLLGQIERLRRERDEAREQVKELTKRVEEFETRMSIISDAMTL
jgi:hypothetical protein